MMSALFFLIFEFRAGFYRFLHYLWLEIMKHDFDEITERLLEKPYWVIDFLPMQVPQESRSQFFAVEQYFLTGERHERLRRQFADVLLGLNCYHALTVNRGDGIWVKNPEPATLIAWLDEALQHGHLCALVDDSEWDTGTVLLSHFESKWDKRTVPVSHALLTASGGDTHLTLYAPSPALLQLTRQLANVAGLHLWQPHE